MWFYSFPDHEEAVGRLALDMGFTNMSLSSEVMPMVRIVPRGFTGKVLIVHDCGVYVYAQTYCMCKFACVCTHTHTHTHTHTYTHTHIHTHTYMHTHVHTHTRVRTHTYTHTYTHTPYCGCHVHALAKRNKLFSMLVHPGCKTIGSTLDILMCHVVYWLLSFLCNAVCQIQHKKTGYVYLSHTTSFIPLHLHRLLQYSIPYSTNFCWRKTLVNFLSETYGK